MAFLRDEDREALKLRLSDDLQAPVKVTLFSEQSGGLYVPGVRQCVSCKETEQLMHEVAELSDNVEVEVVNVKADPATASEWGVSFTPTIAITDGNEDNGVRFLGLPAGYEFLSFLETMISVSQSNGHDLSAETLEKIGSVEEDLDIMVFSTPT